MRRLALLIAHLHRFDAVANDSRGIRDFFCKAGVEARIFAPAADEGQKFEPLDKIKKFINHSSDGVLLSYAGHWDKGERLFQTLPGKKILRYHNVTPARFFYNRDPVSARFCEAGRRGLAPLLRRVLVDCFLADSHFNAKDLLQAGAESDKVHVLPVFHQVEELLQSKHAFTSLSKTPLTNFRISDARVLSELFPKNAQVILMVGRLVPSKGWENFLEVAHAYHTNFCADARFVMVGSGSPRLGKYYRELEARIHHSGLGGRVLYLHSLGAAGLSALYERADAFLLTSEHEGFCVPLVESMAFGLPVLALDRGAVSETLGDAGISWKRLDPLQMAASLHRILSDGKLHRELASRGRLRYEQHFQNSVVAARLRQLLLSV